MIFFSCSFYSEPEDIQGGPGRRGPTGDRGYRGDRGQTGYLVRETENINLFSHRNTYCFLQGIPGLQGPKGEKGETGYAGPLVNKKHELLP